MTKQIILADIWGLTTSDNWIEYKKHFFELVNAKTINVDYYNAINNIEIITIDNSNWVAKFKLYNKGYLIPYTKTIPDRNIPPFWKSRFINDKQIVNKKYVMESLLDSELYRK